MEVCKPVLELKDVPPPPVHSGVPQAHACPAPPHTPPGLSVSVCSMCELLLPACAALRPLPCPGSALCLCRRAPHSFPRAEPPVCPSALHTPLCVAAAHCVQDCWRQGVRVDPEKVWPNIPPPVPVCNGCGATGAPTDGLLGVHLGKPVQKYGPAESSTQESLPPIGVFWDIENCAVPSGRSAAAVVQRLRERFFQGHREAEFICVCDINKENKAVIQELNNCQVTVAHINATAKNAADDKLRQSLRRFAETHTAPATVIVVSSDVNFGSELSDLRHRHGFQVILLHKSQASPALLQHAHRCAAFEELVSGLPPGMQVRTQPSVSLLFVHRLPMHRDAKAVANRLQRLSNNCGGKVLGVSGGCAVLRFASAEAAERARKRMENEDVLGQRILVSHSRDGPDEGEELRPPTAAAAAALFMPVEKLRSPRRQRRASRSCHAPERPYSPRNAGHASSCSPVMKPLPQAVCGATRPATASPQSNTLLSAPGRPVEPPQRSRRRDSPGQLFQVSTPSAFSKLSLQRSFSPMMLSHSSWSSRSASPCPSSRSSPRSAPSPSGCADEPQPFSDGADLQVSNLDYRLPRTELQQSLRDAFARHGRVKSVDLSPHTDYQLKARVHMSSLQQAISAVSLLHRYKIGSKRIQVSLVTGASNKSLTCLSSEIISILQDAPANCLPLYKFTETYERKFGHKLAVGDLYRLPELVCVREQGGGRLVCLLSNTQIRQSPLGSSHTHTHDSSNTASPVLFEELEYHEPVCKRHSAQQDFSEADFDPDSYMIPFVLESLKVLAAHVHSLLQSHEGMLPLLSFPDCYAAEFSALSVAEEGQLEGSVPLEHLITCIPGVTIVTAQNGFKVIKWIHNKPPPPNADLWLQRSKSPVGNPQLIQFSREMVDLMRSQPSCLMPVSRFIPAYHHHFAKQCRVSDYGYTKLLELLEAVPHVLQILGLGSKRLLTLTHRAQVKRFTQDLLKLLKMQASKQVSLQGFGSAYHWCFSRDWQVVDYGMCDLMDLLSEIPDSTISVCQQDADVIISVPKRERSAEEAERTRQFGREVVDLLRHQPHFRMAFSRFIPTYHHHFGRQCKLSYYGFSKLMELFEAIPDILQVLECGEERLLVLTEVERVKALAAQLVKLLRAQRDSGLPVCRLLGEYSKTFGYCLRLQDYEASTLPALLHRLCHVVKVVDTSEGKEVQLINRKSLRALTSQLLALMMSLPEERSDVCVEELRCQYELSYGAPLNPCEYGFISLAELLKSLPYLLQLSEDEGGGNERVRLTRLYQFARRVRALLLTFHYSQLFLSEFSSAFSKHSGETLHTHNYGYNTLEELLAAIPQVVWIKGHGHKKIIVLKNDMRARGSPALTDSPADEPHPEEEPRATTSPASGELELLCLSSSSAVDLLCAPVPSCLPSPALRPDPVQPPDLMHFQPPVNHQPRPANGSDPAQPSAGVWDSPARRSARSRVRLAANFSFTAAQPV